ncbi:MAG: hypothetical protein O2973_13950 [Gemmatimonadetes bacterium]|nr:hypothetical protein [Gemmatimonadota bacterium]
MSARRKPASALFCPYRHFDRLKPAAELPPTLVQHRPDQQGAHVGIVFLRVPRRLKPR